MEALEWLVPGLRRQTLTISWVGIDMTRKRKWKWRQDCTISTADKKEKKGKLNEISKIKLVNAFIELL